MAIGKEASPSSDVFAIGVTLWQALAGRRLFEGDYLEVFKKIMNADIAPLGPLRPDIPGAMVEVVHGALEANPANRFLSAKEMAQALAGVLRSVSRVTEETLGFSVAETRARLTGKPEDLPRGSMTSVRVDVESTVPTVPGLKLPPRK